MRRRRPGARCAGARTSGIAAATSAGRDVVTSADSEPFADLLGLGDGVLPRRFGVLALRFDVALATEELVRPGQGRHLVCRGRRGEQGRVGVAARLVFRAEEPLDDLEGLLWVPGTLGNREERATDVRRT